MVLRFIGHRFRITGVLFQDMRTKGIYIHRLVLLEICKSGVRTSVQNIAYLDDVRLTMGQPVYTKNFTPPSRKLPALRGEGVARSYQTLGDFSYPPDPKPDDLILHGFPVSEESGSGTLSAQYNEIGNWANNTIQAPI